MKGPCPSCGVQGIWTGLADIRRERGALVMVWTCRMCQHRWTDTSERIVPVKASTPSRAPRRRIKR